MWSPTHVQVTVQRARNLRTKGRGATNDAFVLIQMGKEKFQTSVKEKCVDPEWYEECDLTLLRRDAEVVLTVYHRNLLGMDEFLGNVTIPLGKFESHDRRVNKWYPLKGKAGKSDDKYRGEIEVTVAFVVRSYDTQSLGDFSMGKNKHRNSLKGIAVSVGHKIQKMPGRTFSFKSETFDPRARLAKLRMKRNQTNNESSNDADSYDGCDDIIENSIADSELNLDRSAPMKPSKKFGSIYGMKKLSRKLSGSSDNDTKPNHSDIDEKWTSRISSRMKDLTKSEMNLCDVSRNDVPSSREKRSTLESIKNTLRRHTLQLAEPPDFSSLRIGLSPKKHSAEIKVNNNNNTDSSLIDNLPNVLKDVPKEVITQYEKMNHQELVILAIKQQTEIERLRDKISDIETYLDNLLLRVMETTPRILQNPYKSVNPACAR